MDIESAFIEELKALISERGRGFQADLAKKMGIKPPSFSNMLTGRRGMDEDLRIKIAAAVGIDYEALVSRVFRVPKVPNILCARV